MSQLVLSVDGKFLMAGGGYATDPECCCPCECDGDRRPDSVAAINDAWGPEPIEGTVIGSTYYSSGANCDFYGGGKNVTEPYWSIGIDYDHPWCDESPIDFEAPVDALGWPLPRADTVASYPHCGDGAMIKKPYFRGRHRYRGQTSRAKLEYYSYDTTKFQDGGVSYIKIRCWVGYKLDFLSHELKCIDKQYRYIYHYLPGGECGSSVYQTLYHTVGPWVDLAPPIAIEYLSFELPIYTEVTINYDWILLHNYCADMLTGLNCGFIADQGDCPKKTIMVTGEACGCHNFGEANLDPGDAFVLGTCNGTWQFFSTQAIGHFTQYDVGTFVICGMNLETCIHSEMTFTPGYDVTDGGRPESIGGFVLTDVSGGYHFNVQIYNTDADLVVDLFQEPSGWNVRQEGYYEAVIPCDDWMTGPVTLERVSATNLNNVVMQYGLVHTPNCGDFLPTDNYITGYITLPQFPSSMTLEFLPVP
jgi:hypothetical protein